MTGILHATSPASSLTWLGWTDLVVLLGALAACSAAAFLGRRNES
jgi:hypothetical protein